MEITWDLLPPAKKLLKKINIAYEEFKKAKSIAFERQKEFIDEYIARWAKYGNVSPDIMKKLRQREEKQKEPGRISKDIQERNTRAPVLKDTVMCSDTGVTTILDTQNEIVQVAAESNCRRQCKKEGTAFRTAPLLQEFGYCADNKDNVDAVLDRRYVILQEQTSTPRNSLQLWRCQSQSDVKKLPCLSPLKNTRAHGRNKRLQRHANL